MSRSTRRSPAPVLGLREVGFSGVELPGVEFPDVLPMPNRSRASSALEPLRRESVGIGKKDANAQANSAFRAILHDTVERALTLTGASGSALALATNNNNNDNDKTICRARTGHPAPPLGAPVDASHGLSGECLRTGLPVSCPDTENDPRIDPETGRTLGIGSLMAAPIVRDGEPGERTVLGLLEIFSPRPQAFTNEHAAILARLAGMISQAVAEGADLESGAETFPVETPETLPPPLASVASASEAVRATFRPSLLRWAILNWKLLAPLVAGTSLALGYLAGSLIERH